MYIILIEPELKVLPTQPDHPAIPEEEGDDEDAHERVKADDESEGVEVCHCPTKMGNASNNQFYTPLSQIPAGTARRDAQKLTKSEKSKLPRVTAYCTAA